MLAHPPARPIPSLSAGLVPWLLVAAGVLAYSGSFSIPFFFDDHAAITHNPTLRAWPDLVAVLQPPANGSGVTGRPLVNLTLALNHALGGLDPRGYHAVNLLLHLAAALVFFGLVRRTLLLPYFSPADRDRAVPLGAAAALVWTVHPLNTESVSCVIQRTELLVTLFYLLTLYAFLRAVTAPTRRRWRWLAIGACLLGMASKEVMVTAPVVVFLFDRTFVSGSFLQAWRAHRSLHLGLAATWALLAALVLGMGGSRGEAAGFGLGVPWWSYALQQTEALLTYLRLSVWPHPLIIDYGTDLVTHPLAVLPELAVVILLVTACVIAFWKWPAAGFLGCSVLIVLSPSSSVVPLLTQTMAEHRMHLPLCGLVAVGAWIGGRLLGARFFPAALLVSVAGVVLTLDRNRLLQDEVALWRETAHLRPGNARAHASLGLALADRRRPAEAIPHFLRALEIDPADAATHLNLGNARFALGDFPGAAENYRAALTRQPGFASAHSGLGAARFEQGDFLGAEAALEEAIRIDPRHSGARQNLGRLRLAQRRPAEAAEQYAAALEQLPASPDIHYNLGLALSRSGEIDRAIEHFRRALAGQPDPRAHLRFARFLLDAGRTADAQAALETAWTRAPALRTSVPDLATLTRTVPPAPTQ